MCQFPFDLDRRIGGDIELISTYQTVLLNSAFSLHWYIQYMQPIFRRARAANLPIPAVQVSNKIRNFGYCLPVIGTLLDCGPTPDPS